jgi:hypothetical protein
VTPDPEDIGLTERFEVRITPTQLAALKADAQRFGRKPAQSARFAIDFYLSATPPATVTPASQDGTNG